MVAIDRERMDWRIVDGVWDGLGFDEMTTDKFTSSCFSARKDDWPGLELIETGGKAAKEYEFLSKNPPL